MRPIVLIFIAHYLPGFKIGGPLRSIVNLVDHLSDEFDFRIFTSDRDLGDQAPYPSIVANRWVEVGCAKVYYASPEMRSLSGMAKFLKQIPYDLLYINSFFSFRNSLLPLFISRLVGRSLVPAVVAPRGEFSQGALALKAWKKRPYTAIAKLSGLLKGLTWQASTEYEAEDIRSVMKRAAINNIAIARNLSSRLPLMPPDHVPRSPGAAFRIIFLSRISPKKNLDFALDVLARVRCSVKFCIYGPHEDLEYLRKCKSLAENLGSHISVEWHNAIPPERVAGVMAEHDLFFFPTRGENFGHVIAEALGAGTPILISDATPWRNLAAEGVGNDFSLAVPEAFAARIEELADLKPPEVVELRARVSRYARGLQAHDQSVTSHRTLFRASITPARSSYPV
ncbi:glycosyltransferase [Variovorax paradoxus]|uniref:glycosyltransferase n=1 Tax=Variovorax paradoxus TaxID=34073 RepID=UPI0029C97B1D|nr:glycosyltransferase [Variovorax paradoxus]WPH22439.1 glycosyltransferase [Variovorax paradoxus]